MDNSKEIEKVMDGQMNMALDCLDRAADGRASEQWCYAHVQILRARAHLNVVALKLEDLYLAVEASPPADPVK